MSVMDYSIVAAFCALMLGVGLYYSRRVKSSDEYVGNDRTVSWWMAGIGFYMNSFSALGFVMYSALAYRFGWVGVLQCWMFSPAVALGAYFLAVRWRRAALKSPIDYVSTRYTPRMCSALALLGLPMQMADNAFKLLAIGAIVVVGTGIPPVVAISICGAVVAIYATCGGLRAILTCSVLQFMAILLLMLLLFPFAFTHMPDVAQSTATGLAAAVEGFKEFVGKAEGDGTFAFFRDKYTWFYTFIFFCSVVLTQSTNWSLVQRYTSTRSERDARKAGYLVAVLQLVAPPVFFLPAMAAKYFLEVPPDAYNQVFARVCHAALPAGLLGLMVVAMFASTMGAVSANVNAAASVVVNEIYVKLHGGIKEHRLLVAKLTTIIVSVIVFALAIWLNSLQGSDDLFNMCNKVFAIFLPPTAIPMIVGVLVRGISRRAGMMGLLGGSAVGFAVFGLSFIYPTLTQPVVMFPTTAAATGIFLVLGTFLRPDATDDRRTVEEFFGRFR